MSGSGVYDRGEQKCILFIAADDDALLAYHAIAQSMGLEAELARDGHEGLLLANLARPDLVILDLRHPELNGDWIIRRLRAAAGTRVLPVVVVGAEGDMILHPLRSGGDRIYAVDAEDPSGLLKIMRALLAPGHAIS